jgi:hypothetical protein
VWTGVVWTGVVLTAGVVWTGVVFTAGVVFTGVVFTAGVVFTGVVFTAGVVLTGVVLTGVVELAWWVDVECFGGTCVCVGATWVCLGVTFNPGMTTPACRAVTDAGVAGGCTTLVSCCAAGWDGVDDLTPSPSPNAIANPTTAAAASSSHRLRTDFESVTGG